MLSNFRVFNQVVADEVTSVPPNRSLLKININLNLLDEQSHKDYIASREGILAEAALTRVLQIYCASSCFMRYASGDYSDHALPRDHTAIMSLQMYPLSLIQRIHRELLQERILRRQMLHGQPDVCNFMLSQVLTRIGV